MSLQLRSRQDVVVLTPTVMTDDYGNAVADWINAASATYKALIEPTASTEVTAGRDTVVSDWLLILPIDAAIGPLARVQYGGTTFEVVGLPARFDQPVGAYGRHIEARLVSVSG